MAALDEPRLREKFHSLVDPVLGDAAAATWSALRSTPDSDVRTLCELVTPASSSYN